MCPLRYILLLLSLLVAMIGLSQALTEEHEEHSMVEDEKDGKREPKSTFRTLVDMLNGKYLYDAWKLSRLQVKAD